MDNKNITHWVRYSVTFRIFIIAAGQRGAVTINIRACLAVPGRIRAAYRSQILESDFRYAVAVDVPLLPGSQRHPVAV